MNINTICIIVSLFLFIALWVILFNQEKINEIPQLIRDLWNGPCKHIHYSERRWLDSETGTPYYSFRCKDCGHFDRGHIYADTEGWEGHTET
jgi:hypothetical protein